MRYKMHMLAMRLCAKGKEIQNLNDNSIENLVTDYTDGHCPVSRN